jgi:hypothetical protein
MQSNVLRVGIGVAVAVTWVLVSPQMGSADPNGTSGQLSDAQVAAIKTQLDETAWDIGPTPPLTTAQQKTVDAKVATARSLFVTHAMSANGEAVPATGVPVASALAENQNAQTTTYYCGPAAVKEVLGQRGIGGIQANLADAMNTTTDGTAWSGVNADVSHTTGHPVPDVLNDRISSAGQSFTYISQAVANPASAANISDYKGYLQSDIYVGSALVGDAYEVPGGPHLVGHPNITIYHWFDIRGYNTSGANTLYEDSVHGSATSWAGSVPAYSTLSSTTIAEIVGGRGYVW